MLCAQNRGDVVALLFADLAKGYTREDAEDLLVSIREGINIIFPFIGFLNCIPACLGLINEGRSRGFTSPKQPNRYRESSKPCSIADKLCRESLSAQEWFEKGKKTRHTIYRGVGNAEVHAMLSEWFPEVSKY